MRGRVYILSAFEKGLSTVLLSLGSLLVAYLIGPEDYGKFGLLFGVYIFSILINDSGTATSILNFSLEYTSQRAAHIRKFNNKSNIISILLFVLITSYYVIVNFSSSWLISVFVLVISLRIHSKTIIPHSILTKKNRYIELNQITLISSVSSFLIISLISVWIDDFTLASLYVLFLATFKYFLLIKKDKSTFNISNSIIQQEMNELKEYSSGIFRISLTNQTFLVVLDFILSETISFELFGKYKLDLFLINTLIYTIGSSIERIWLANYDSYAIIPKHYKVRLVMLLYFLLSISIPIHYIFSVATNYLGRSQALLSTDYFILVISCYITVPLHQMLIIRVKKTIELTNIYALTLIILRLLTIACLVGLMLVSSLSFDGYLYIFSIASIVLFLVQFYLVTNVLSNK